MENKTYTCLCAGFPTPDEACKYVVATNKNLCGLKGDMDCKFRGVGCCECGALTKEEAEIKCICGGDKDDCHGLRIWCD